MSEFFTLSYSGQLGMESSGAESFLNSIQNQIDNISKYKDIMQTALSNSHKAYNAIKNSITTISTELEKMDNLYQTIKGYKESLENYDIYLATLFVTVDDLTNGLGVIDLSLQIGDYGIQGGDLISKLDQLRKAGFTVYQKGDYLIIKGLPSSREGLKLLEDIKGTRYAIGSDAFYDAGLGMWHFPAGVNVEEFFIAYQKILGKQFKGFGNKVYGFKDKSGWEKAGTVLSYIGIALDVGSGIFENYELKETSGIQYVGDAAITAIWDAGGMAAGAAGAEIGATIGAPVGATIGGAIGSVIPIAGTAAGAAVGAAVGAGIGGFLGGIGVGYVYDQVVDGIELGGRTLKGWASFGMEWFSDLLNGA